jgi:hypothetical protein
MDHTSTNTKKKPATTTHQGGADMQPTQTIEGSPAKQPCANIGLSGTADEQSAAGDIKTAGSAGETITAGPVPLYLIPQTLSAEIHAHGGDISEIAVKRTGQHVYAITLTKTEKQRHGVKQEKSQKPNQNQNRGEINAD